MPLRGMGDSFFSFSPLSFSPPSFSLSSSTPSSFFFLPFFYLSPRFACHPPRKKSRARQSGKKIQQAKKVKNRQKKQHKKAQKEKKNFFCTQTHKKSSPKTGCKKNRYFQLEHEGAFLCCCRMLHLLKYISQQRSILVLLRIIAHGLQCLFRQQAGPDECKEIRL